MDTPRFRRYRFAVSERMKQVYGIDLCDAGIDDQPVLKAYQDGWTADDFVSWFGEKYDLTPVAEWSYGMTGQ